MNDRQPDDVVITLTEPGRSARDITLSYPLDPAYAMLLRAIHEGGNALGLIECRMHDDEPRLRHLREADGRVHGAFLYLRTNPHAAIRNSFDLSLCHWPKTIVSGSHAVSSPMTAEHRRRQEYIADRGSDAGYSVELEKSLARGTRSDVVVTGSETLAAEVQQSHISVATLLRRDKIAVAVGAVPAWIADAKLPPWGFRVAHVETNERFGMNRGQWTVSTGPRTIEHEKCRPGARIKCPNGRNWCGKYHLTWVPMQGLTIDHIVEQVPGGGLVRLRTGTKQGTILTRPEDRAMWLNEHPAVDMEGLSIPRRRNSDGRIRHNRATVVDLRDLPQVKTTRTDSVRPHCVICKKELFLTRSDRPVCERCRLDNRGESHEMMPVPVSEPPDDSWRWLAPGYDY